ncbi:MAG: hypothetical protein IPI28_07335 [Candidatus Omnitrophica bacterium]|nr:hypothetical protein [Candidatus Omnitrophota bacterium]
MFGFWKRWHISHSGWLRDYLTFRWRTGRAKRTYVNLMLTMLLGGLWHGGFLAVYHLGWAHGPTSRWKNSYRSVSGLQPDRPERSG